MKRAIMIAAICVAPSACEVIDNIKKLLPAFNAQLPPAIRLTLRGDRSQTIRDGFHDEAHLVSSEGRPFRDPILREIRLVGAERLHPLEIPGGHHGDHARQCAGLRMIRDGDPGVGVQGTDERDVDHVRQAEVINVLAPPLQQTRVLRPSTPHPHVLPDDRGHARAPRDGARSAARRSATPCLTGEARRAGR